MPGLNFQNYLAGFKSTMGVFAGVGAVVPGFAYFTSFAPPFGEIALLTAAFAVATIFITYYYSPSESNESPHRLPPIIRLAMKVLIASFLLLILYLIALDMCSVQIAGTNKRVQIGFDRFDWSLTEYGKQTRNADANAQPKDWIAEEGFKGGVAKLFWQPWSIYLSGALLILLFTITFVLWTFGWSLIAKENAISRVETGHSGAALPQKSETSLGHSQYHPR